MDSPKIGRKKPFQISNLTKEKANSAKAFIEEKYSKLKHLQTSRRENWTSLQLKMRELRLSQSDQQLIKQEICHRESLFMRESRRKHSIQDFSPISMIGKGAFGQVTVCSYKPTGEILAIKSMDKSEMLQKKQVRHIKAERNLLAMANTPWIVDLKYSFQDEKQLYLVMEYVPGGDLMNLLMKKSTVQEDDCRFYAAEIVLAVETVHKLNYIHRDIKPDNILIDSRGHIKLSDFGLCTLNELRAPKPHLNLRKLEEDAVFEELLEGRADSKRTRKMVNSTVGTPDYIAPEVFNKTGYSESVDWWSVGCILYEMIVGFPPFYSEQPSMTCQKIQQWRKFFKIPEFVSRKAADLLNRLICEPEDRIQASQIKVHPFFKNVDWNNIRNSKAPWVPKLKSNTDTTHFDKFEQARAFYPEKKKRARKDLNFVGYSFNKEVETQQNSLALALKELENVKNSFNDQIRIHR